jgi:hypothetical protein
MSDNTKQSIFRWGDFAFKIVVTAGTIILIFLKSTFATKDELEAEREHRRQLGTTVLLLTQQKSQLEDLEARMRKQEARHLGGYEQIDGRTK